MRVLLSVHSMHSGFLYISLSNDKCDSLVSHARDEPIVQETRRDEERRRCSSGEDAMALRVVDVGVVKQKNNTYTASESTDKHPRQLKRWS